MSCPIVPAKSSRGEALFETQISLVIFKGLSATIISGIPRNQKRE
jgi:hypothetical protein